MEADFWHQKWHAQQIGFHLDTVNQWLVRYWSELNLASTAKVFVPLCGKSLDLRYLAELGHEVRGCEFNQLAVEQFFQENKLVSHKQIFKNYALYQSEKIEIYQGDIFNLPPVISQVCDGFYDRAALIAWPESMRRSYAKCLAELVQTGAKGLLITLDYPQISLDGPPFAVSDTWVKSNLSQDFEIELLNSVDVLADNPRFLKKQVPWLTESVYKLVRKVNSNIKA